MTFFSAWRLGIALIFIIGIAVLVYQMRKAIKARTTPHVEPETVSGYDQGKRSEFQRPAWASKELAEMELIEVAKAQAIQNYERALSARDAEYERRLEPFAKFMEGK